MRLLRETKQPLSSRIRIAFPQTLEFKKGLVVGVEGDQAHLGRRLQGLERELLPENTAEGLLSQGRCLLVSFFQASGIIRVNFQVLLRQ